MAAYLKHLSVFTGESQGNNTFLEQAIEREMRAFGRYAATRFDLIHFGCGEEGRAATFRESVLEHGGTLVDTRPEFYKNIDHRHRLDLARYWKAEAAGAPQDARDNIEANLDFKRSFLVPGGVRVVFPGAFGTRAEKAVSEEESDTGHRVGIHAPLVPTLIFNIDRGHGRGFYQGEIDSIRELVEDQPYLSHKMNIARYVQTAEDAIALIEAYEALGPVPAKDMEHFVPIVDGVPIKDIEFNVDDVPYMNRQLDIDFGPS